MPDTAIFHTLNDLFDEGCDAMNAKDFSEWLVRVEAKLDNQTNVTREQGERIAKVEEKATAAHRRLDESIPALKGPGRPAWVAIALAIIAGIVSIGVASISAKASNSAWQKIDAVQKEVDKK